VKRSSLRRWTILNLLFFTASFLLVPSKPGHARQAAATQQSGDEAGAAEILEKYIASVGGRDAIRSIKTEERETEQRAFGMVSHGYSIRERETRRFYQRTEGPQGIVEAGFDGTHVWRKASFFRGYLPDTDPIVKRTREREPELYQYKESGKKYYRVPNEKVDGVEYLVVTSTAKDPQGVEVPIRYYFDPATYLLRQVVLGLDVTVTTRFDDYRTVDGHPVAFTTQTKQPNATVVIKLTRIRFNVPVDADKFAYRDDTEKKEGGEAAKASVPAASGEGGIPNPAATTPAKPLGPDDPIDDKTRLDTFELVWKTINDSYWDPKFGGVDWNAVHEKYLPLGKSTSKNEEFHRLLSRMLGELDQSHFRIIQPKEAVSLHTRAGDIENGAIGIDLRWVDGQLLVVQVREDYPAEKAGIRPGYVVEKVNGKASAELLADLRKKNPGFQLSEEIQRPRAALSEMRGKPEAKTTLEVLDAQDKHVTLDLVRKPVPLDQGALDFESRRLDDNIGYIRFNIFLGDLIEKFDKALHDLQDTKALILDIRGNPGGVGQMAPTIASRLCANDGVLGVSHFRYSTESFKFTGAGAAAYRGKVVLLVDGLSGSTSEVFSGGLQEAGRVTVIGSKTAGAVLPSLQSTLPTGAVLQYVISDFKTPKGVLLEGHGVIPDISARPSRAALLAGHDPELDRAIEFIQKGR
jgi:carboxyl-terminal processing protease